jgi:2',3'-cyclic-nucleotide 2'-phosphodiesterase (5'-nucleotidase family)
MWWLSQSSELPPARRRVALLCLLACGMASAGACRREGKPAADAGRAVTATAHAPAPPPPRGKQITIVYASNLLAEYEPCGCPVHPLGGIARRATLVDRARSEADAVLVLDAGDLFLPLRESFYAGRSPDPGEVERRGRLLATSYRRIGTTALTPGERDLALGLPLLRRLAKAGGIPIVSANLYGRDGKRLFDADRIVDAAGIKVGIFGVSATDDRAPWQAAGIDARDPTAAARDAVASLRARGAALVIALLHVGALPESRKLLEAVPGIDWAVLGHSGTNLDIPEAAGGAHMLEAMNNGKHLGRLDLHVVGDKLTFVDRGERAMVETMLADHRRQLTDYDKRLGETDPAAMRDYYNDRRKQIGQAIARETALLERLPVAITGSWFENRIIPLDSETPNQTGVAVLVDGYNRESARRAAAGKPAGLGHATERHGTPAPATPAPGTPNAAPSYLGSNACGACHAPALAFWKTTKHAQALSALARVGRNRDPSCVGCHVTGYLQGGWTLEAGRRRGAASPRRGAGARGDAEAPCSAGEDCSDGGAGRSPLANVGCETCHGAGRAHVEAVDKRKSTTRAVPEAVCRGCHTTDMTNGEFDFRKFTAAIVGPGHGAPAQAGKPLAPGKDSPL